MFFISICISICRKCLVLSVVVPVHFICFTVGENVLSIPLYVLTCKEIDNKATLTLTLTIGDLLSTLITEYLQTAYFTLILTCSKAFFCSELPETIVPYLAEVGAQISTTKIGQEKVRATTFILKHGLLKSFSL